MEIERIFNHSLHLFVSSRPHFQAVLHQKWPINTRLLRLVIDTQLQPPSYKTLL